MSQATGGQSIVCTLIIYYEFFKEPRVSVNQMHGQIIVPTEIYFVHKDCADQLFPNLTAQTSIFIKVKPYDPDFLFSIHKLNMFLFTLK